MTEPVKKLSLFAISFVVIAVIVFFISPSQIVHNNSQPPNQQFSQADSLRSVLTKELDRLKKLIEKEPNNVEYLIQTGNVYFDLGQPNESIEHYEKALAIDPKNPFVLTDCAVMYSHLGQFAKSIDYLDSAIVIKPDLPQAYFNKGAIYLMGLGEKDSAIAAWTEYIKIAPDSSQANLVRRQIEEIKAGNLPHP